MASQYSHISSVIRSQCVVVTGSISCGKSTVLALIAAKGYQVFDADDFVRQLSLPGEPAYIALKKNLPAQYFLTDGRLNRQALREALWLCDETKDHLERLIHPLVEQRFHHEVAQIIDSGGVSSTHPYFFYEASLIFETHVAHRFKKVVVVACEADHQLKRIMSRYELDRSAAQALIDTQMSQSEKKKRADYVLCTSCSAIELQRRVDELCTTLSHMTCDL